MCQSPSLGHSAAMASPITPWDNSPRNRFSPVSSTSPNPSAGQSRMFGRNGAYSSSAAAVAASTNRPIQVERAPIPIPLMANSAARRLSRRAELLDKRVNVHVRPTADSRPEDHTLPELEGSTPIIAELEGSSPRHPLPELEGSTPDTLLNAVTARVIPANTVRTVKVKAKRLSKRIFSPLRPEKTHYQVACSNAAAEVAAAEHEKKEKQSFADRINSLRRYEGRAPLEMDDELNAHAQQHADNLPILESPTVVHTPLSPLLPPTPSSALNSAVIPQRADTVTTIRSPLDHRLSIARIVSSPGLGGMACVERWYSGKHRRHTLGVISPERHLEDCPCRLRVVYDTMMSEGFTKIGVGRGVTEGRAGGVWVVELAA